jgi:hypothetical protein
MYFLKLSKNNLLFKTKALSCGSSGKIFDGSFPKQGENEIVYPNSLCCGMN